MISIAKGSTVAGKKAQRKVRVLKGTGKLRARFCVRVDLNPSVDKMPKKPKGTSKKVQPAAVQFRGCFTTEAKATAAAKKFATLSKLPTGKGKRSRKSKK